MPAVKTLVRKRLSRILPRSGFIRNVSILVGGTAASQGLLVIVSPVLTRLYSPEDFGVLAVFSAILGIISVVSSLRYQLAIPLPERDDEAAAVTFAGFLANGGMVLLTVVAVALFGETLSYWVGVPDLASYLWLLPIGVFAIGVYQVLHYWAIRTGAFTALTRSKLVQTTSQVCVQIGAFPLGPVALMIGHVTGQSMGATRLGMLAVKQRGGAFRNVGVTQVRDAIIRYRRFPVYSTWGALLNSAGSRLVPVLFAALFGPASAGIYFLAHRVLAMPMQLVGRAVADVFLSRAAHAARADTMGSLVRSIHVKLTQIALPPAIFLAALAPDLFSILFGADWELAGEFARWMSPWLFFVFVTSPLSTIPSVLEKQGKETVFQFVLFVVRLGAIYFGALYGGLLTAVIAFSFASAVCWIGFLLWILIASGNSLSNVGHDVVRVVPQSVGVAAPALVLSISGVINVWTIIATTCLSAMLAVAHYRSLIAQTKEKP